MGIGILENFSEEIHDGEVEKDEGNDPRIAIVVMETSRGEEIDDAAKLSLSLVLCV